MKFSPAELKLVPHGEIFRTGISLIDEKEVRWVAKKGGIEDWAIYQGPRTWNEDRIAREGDKIYSDRIIKSLLNPTVKMFNLYRY